MASKGEGGTSRKTGLHGMLESVNSLPLEKLLPFVATFNNRRREGEKAVPIARVHTRYNDIVADVTRDVGQQA